MAYDIVLADRLRALLGEEPGLSERKMFGGLAFLIDGHMAVAAGSGGALLLRVDPARTEALAAEPHAEPMVMRGRAMTGWLHVAGDGLGTDEELADWVAHGVAYVRTLPPK